LLALAWLARDSAHGAAAVVREGPFAVKLVEPGTLQALRSLSYASSIQSNQAKIIALVPEGSFVKKGDPLVAFDPTPFQDEIRKNEALLVQAQADLRKARQDVRLQRLENEQQLATARQRLERTSLELKDVEAGKGKLREEEAVAAVANAERELQRAETNLEDLRPLLAEGFITKLELERAEQQTQKAREDLALAVARRDALLQFGRPVELAQARSEALLTREGLQQLQSAAASRLEQKQAAAEAAESRIQDAEAKLKLAREQLALTEVRADVAGIVVYREVFFGSERRKPQVGDQVWANQPLLILPDVSQMLVETRVRETDIHKVERNQRVSVRVDAYPDLELTGQVSLVGTLAQEEPDRRGVKYFDIKVAINESDPRLRPGMTARVEILVEERPHALFVPLEAVFEREGKSVCYAVGRGGLDERQVLLGPSNTDFVVVERGLAAGERVSLRDPLAPTAGAAPLP
jgi:HlyD family secretion protein